MAVKSGYKQTEVGVIPTEWDSTSVRDLASPIRNAIVGGPFGSDLVSSDYVEDGVPVVRGQNMGPRFVSGTFAFVTRAKASSLEANLARPGDLVFTQRGTLGQVSLVPDKPYDRYLISQSQMKLTVNRKAADPLFFYYVFSSTEQQEFIRQNTIQTGVPHINLGILRALPVQRPSLSEQEAIAEALSDADSLIESLEQLLVKKRQLKQGAIQELLSGKKRLPGFREEWEVKRLGSVLKFQVGFPFSSAFFNVKGQGIRLAKNRDLKSDDQVFFYSGKFGHEVLVQDGDVLVGMDGDFLPCLWAKGPALLNQRIGRILPLAGLNCVFAFYYLIEPLKEIENATSSTTVKHLSHGDVEGIEKALPPVEEQTAIAAILSDMDAEITALKAKLAKARQLKQGMMQELLTGRIRLV
jgi:type I restriction enzyme, S subunit